jgi:hypothetical protein
VTGTLLKGLQRIKNKGNAPLLGGQAPQPPTVAGINAYLSGHYSNTAPVKRAEPKALLPLEMGNIDLAARPVVKNADGSISTVRSISVGFDGAEVLIPTVSDDGRIWSNQEAIEAYKRNGRHLGKFKTPDEASRYAEILHRQQEQMYAQRPQR